MTSVSVILSSSMCSSLILSCLGLLMQVKLVSSPIGREWMFLHCSRPYHFLKQGIHMKKLILKHPCEPETEFVFYSNGTYIMRHCSGQIRQKRLKWELGERDGRAVLMY